MLRLSYRDSVTPALQARIAALAPEGRKALMRQAGKGVERLFKRHFRDREERTPNKRGWPRQHFWGSLVKVTAFDPATATADSATIIVGDPAINQKIHGGSIQAPPGKMLAIPLRSKAYGVKPSSGIIPDLFIIKSRRKKQIFLAGLEGKGKSAKLVLYYILVKRTKPQAPDRDAIPTQAAIQEEMRVAATRHLVRN